MRIYVRLDADFLDDARVADIDNPMAELLWLRGLAWSKKQLTDGHVPRSALKRIGLGLGDVQALADELVRVGLWERDPDGSHRVPLERWSRHQTTREEVEASRAAEAERKRQWREKRAGGTRRVANTDEHPRDDAPARPPQDETPAHTDEQGPQRRATERDAMSQRRATSRDALAEAEAEAEAEADRRLSSSIRGSGGAAPADDPPPTPDPPEPTTTTTPPPSPDLADATWHALAQLQHATATATGTIRNQGRGPRRAWLAAARRNAATERADDLAALHATHPNWTPDQLATHLHQADQTPPAPAPTSSNVRPLRPQCPSCQALAGIGGHPEPDCHRTLTAAPTTPTQPEWLDPATGIAAALAALKPERRSEIAQDATGPAPAPTPHPNPRDANHAPPRPLSGHASTNHTHVIPAAAEAN